MIRDSLYPLAHKPCRYAVGLMSGTSVDGVDAAVVSISGHNDTLQVSLLAFLDYPYSSATKERIFSAFSPDTSNVISLGELNMELGEIFSNAALAAIDKAGLKPDDIDFIASHGQTVYHSPTPKAGHFAFTMQLGEGDVIARRTHIPCVSDFRTADIAAGGEGAPLVPLSEYLLYKDPTNTVLLQNIGGIGNMTVLPAACDVNRVYAFDTGPGNMIIDEMMRLITHGEQDMDKGGALALSGKVNEELVNDLLQHEYLRRPLPKSTGREDFGREYTAKAYASCRLKNMSDADIISSFTAFTARSIINSYKDYVLPKYKASLLIVGGGGSHNAAMLGELKSAFAPYGVEVKTQEDMGLSSDAKEAVAFALLGDCTLRGIAGSIPSVTGAKASPVLGKLSFI